MDMAPADSPKTVTRSGVAAEGADVVPHPGERGDLVAQAEVGGVVAVAEVEEPVGARAPVDRHADHTVAGEAAAVVAPAGGVAEGAARAPHHHRKAARSRVGRPDVQVEAVVAGNGGVEEHAAGVVAVELRLRWLGTESGGVTHTAPRLHRLRRSEPVGADGRRGVRDAQKRMDSTNGGPADLTMSGRDDRLHVSPLRHRWPSLRVQASARRADSASAELPGDTLDAVARSATRPRSRPAAIAARPGDLRASRRSCRHPCAADLGSPAGL